LKTPERSAQLQEKTERWFELCQQAAVEQDPQKLLALIKEINDLLEAKEARLQGQRKGSPATGETAG
jgi:hypothetical protein